MRLPVSKKVAYLVLGPLPHLAGYVGGPLRVSRKGRRRGWTKGRPGRANVLGLIPVGAGAAFIAWAALGHYRKSPDEARLTPTPDYLVTEGPYAITRNPMYVGGAAMWAGWSLFFGNLRVAASGLGWFLAINRWGIPFEERMLQRKFGDTYEDYRRRVPRWIAV